MVKHAGLAWGQSRAHLGSIDHPTIKLIASGPGKCFSNEMFATCPEFACVWFSLNPSSAVGRDEKQRAAAASVASSIFKVSLCFGTRLKTVPMSNKFFRFWRKKNFQLNFTVIISASGKLAATTLRADLLYIWDEGDGRTPTSKQGWIDVVPYVPVCLGQGLPKPFTSFA